MKIRRERGTFQRRLIKYLQVVCYQLRRIILGIPPIFFSLSCLSIYTYTLCALQYIYYIKSIISYLFINTVFLGSSAGKESTCNAGDLGLIPGLGRYPGGGKGYPLQYSGLENPMDRGARWSTVHGVAKVSDTIQSLNNNIHIWKIHIHIFTFFYSSYLHRCFVVN